MSKRVKKLLKRFGISGAILLVAFLGIYIFCKVETNKIHTYSFSPNHLDEVQDGLSVSVELSKKWKDNSLHPDTSFGAQYDFVIHNENKNAFNNWSAKFTFPDKLIEDSTWNGQFTYEEKSIIFTPESDLNSILCGKDCSFGGVYYSTSYYPPSACEISGHFNIKKTDLVVYWLVLALAVVWFVGLLINIAVIIKTHNIIKRVERDAQIIEQTMNTITGFIDAKDTYTKGHSIRVACYSQEIAKRLKLGDDETRNVYYITLMHDCGKIGIPDAILKKPGKLTDDEFETIKQHTVIGNQILEKFTAIDGIRDGAHYHHEHYDGNGYPDGLKGEEIPLLARIICVADSYDAMSSTRCYRPSLTEEKIISELKDNSGIQFDPDIVEIMLEMIEDGFTNEIREKYPSTTE